MQKLDHFWLSCETLNTGGSLFLHTFISSYCMAVERDNVLLSRVTLYG
jgi:hypothetical protein